MLDDVFSGLDATSEDRIFSRLLGKNGLLRTRGITVILVTHAAHRLSYADHIIALTPKGSIAEQGQLQHLLSKNGYVAGLAARHTEERDEPTKEDPSPSKAVANDELARREAAADLKRPTGDWAVYKYYFRSTGWCNIAIWSAMVCLYAFLDRFPSK